MWPFELKEGSKQILSLTLMRRAAAAGKCVSTLPKLSEPPGTRESQVEVGWKEGRADPGQSSHRI